MILNFKRKNKPKYPAIFIFAVILTAFFVLIGIVNMVFTDMENFVVKNDEISKIYENWLILRTDSLVYMASSRFFKDKERLIKSWEQFDLSMEGICDEKIFQRLEKYYPQINDIRQCVFFVWQRIQFKLVQVIMSGQKPDVFSYMIVYMTKDAGEFEHFFKTLKTFVQQANLNHIKQVLLFSYFLISCVIIFLFAALFINMRTKHKLLTEEEIKRMAKAVIRIRDEERKRIAFDIHDSLVHKLRELKLRIKSRDSENSFAAEGIGECIDIARDISFNLVPMISAGGEGANTGENFIDTIRSYAAEVLFMKGMKMNVSGAGFTNVILSEELRISMFRMIQEALNNAVKYSEARFVDIRILYSFPYIIITVKDDGRGLPEGKVSMTLNKDHMGLYGIRERAEFLGGTLRISSKSGKGTKLIIKIPHGRKGGEDS